MQMPHLDLKRHLYLTKLVIFQVSTIYDASYAANNLI